MNSDIFREKCGENMQSLKKIIYKVPIIDKLIKKWEKCNNEITKLRSENKELKACIQKMSFEVRRNEVFREIDDNHFRKVQRDMEAMCHPERSILKQAHPLVSIIIVNHNGKSQLSKLLKSLHERTFYDNFEIIMVDNASEDESLDIIKEYQAVLPIKVIRNDENLSFSAANNIGANYAEGEYLLFLNNDTEVTDGWLDELLLSALNNENVGAIGATLVYPEIPNYSINKGKSYTIQHEGIAFRDGIRENIRYWQPYNVNNGEELHACMSREDHEWACVTAAVLLVRKENFWLCEGFDEQYLYGYEDVDFCLKLQKRGLRNYCCGNCLVFHYEFGTQSTDEPTVVRERRARNMIIFRGKWQEYLQKRMENKED